MLKHKDGSIRPFQPKKIYLNTENLDLLADILDQEEHRPPLSRFINGLISDYLAKHGECKE